MLKIYYNKLCRDNTPDMIHTRGYTCEVRELGHAEYQREVVRKVFEEASGVAAHGGREHLLEELADLIVSIDAVKTEFNITPEEFDEALRKNVETKGKFDKKLYLSWSSDTEYNTRDTKHGLDI